MINNELQNSYTKHVLEGKTLPINYSTYIAILQSVAFPSVNVSITRSASQLKTVFITLDQDRSRLTAADDTTAIFKDWSQFLHPMNGVYDFTKEVEYQVQMGHKRCPEYPVKSISQAFFELQKALGIAGSEFHSISPTRAQHQHDH